MKISKWLFPFKFELSPSFIWLNATQFFGAFNDNLFKFFVAYFLIEFYGEGDTTTIMAVSGAIFVIPFLLFSHLGGVFADYFSKRNVVVATKILEIAVMTFGCFAFILKSPLLAYSALFMMGAQSALFGPSKYGIIPEIVKKEHLSKANSLLVSFTYISIILGTTFASKISEIFHSNFPKQALFCIAIAVAGTLTSLFIMKTPAERSERKASFMFLMDIWKSLKDFKKDNYLFLAIIGSAYFLFIGAFMQLNIIPYGINILDLTKEQSTRIFLLGAFGIGFGSWLAGRMSGRNIEFGVVPLGALILSVSSISLKFTTESVNYVSFLVFMLGTGAGLFTVPLNSFIQYRSPQDRRGEIIGVSNFLSFLGVFIAAVFLFLLDSVFKFDPASCFAVIGLITLGLTILTLIILPDFFIRFIGVMITRLFYRIRVEGIENVPIEGAGLIVCNHVSWVDAFLLLATQQRRLRFVMYRNYYEKKFLNPLMKLMRVIPISFSDSPKQLVESIKNIRDALDDGYIVCIFAEGSITRSGIMREFRKGFEKIVKGTNYPIIPTYIGGAWGSIFSYYKGKTLSHLPSAIPYPITLIFGKNLPSTTPAAEVRLAVMELAGQSFDLLKPKRKSLIQMFIIKARESFFRKAISDTTGKNLTYGQTLISSVALSEQIKKITGDQEMVGILLPSSVGAVLSNFAISLLGKVPVNLNFTASQESVNSAINQCDIKTVISSHKFAENMKNLSLPEGTVFLEDIIKLITKKDKRKAVLKSLFVPSKYLAHAGNFDADDLATIIFSSGSTGEPKGVMLTHHNIISNIESFRMVLHTTAKDDLCAALPFFHSFGFTATLWLPLISGFSASYHSNPLDAGTIASVVKENESTILLATPTFLSAYIRRASKVEFKSLRLVIVGAEKLKNRISDAFVEKFGIRPLEGYGTTELSPIAAVNLPDIEVDGVYQIGSKDDSVGHPIPGVTVKIVDIETGKTMPIGESGLLLVKGPNVMKGYLNQPEKTASVLKDGWYNTGDIAHLDKDGFVTITDRLSRFSKIGGEMVPHIAVEEEYLKKLNTTEIVLTVTSVSDEKRGEKIVVLYTDKAGTGEELHKIITASDIPNLWKPRADDYCKVNEIPLLGSGKLDLKGIKELAKETCGLK